MVYFVFSTYTSKTGIAHVKDVAIETYTTLAQARKEYYTRLANYSNGTALSAYAEVRDSNGNTYDKTFLGDIQGDKTTPKTESTSATTEE